MTVVRRGWLAFAASVALSYVTFLVASLVTANLTRGLLTLELHLMSRSDGSTPVWLGVVAYGQGVALLAIAALFAGATLLGAGVEVTRGVRDSGRAGGPKPRPWTPFFRAVPRSPRVAVGLVRVLARAVVFAVGAGVVFALSAVLIPVALLLAIATWRRPSLRHRWFTRWPMVAAVPLGLAVHDAVRSALWLPYVVVDRTSTGEALECSRRAASRERAGWWRAARPFAPVALLGISGIAVMIAMTSIEVPTLAVGFATMAIAVVFVLAYAIAATIAHERAEPGEPAGAGRLASLLERIPRLRQPSPGLALFIAVVLVTPTAWMTMAAPSGAAVADGQYVVNDLGDSATPGADECTTADATCTLRAAVALVNGSPVGGDTITFGVSGTIDLVSRLQLARSVVVDGAGQHVTISSSHTDSGGLLLVAAATQGGGEAPPENFTLRNLTFGDDSDPNGSAVEIGSANATIDRATFNATRRDGPGGALLNNGHTTIVNSTFWENADDGAPGGGIVANNVVLSVNHSSFVHNHNGGVVDTGPFASTVVTNSLFQSSGGGGFNCPANASVAGNVSNDGSCDPPPADPVNDPPNPRLNVTDPAMATLPIADNGGWVATVAIGQSSVAVAAGDTNYCMAEDARGVTRPQNCDSGSYQTTTGTQTTVTASGSPTFGSPVHVTVTVSHPTALPTGTVTLTGGPSPLGPTALSDGAASFDVAGLTVGDHTLTATYVPAGGSSLDGSTGHADITVVKQISHTVLAVDPSTGTSAAGAPISLTATVTNGADAFGAKPTGEVAFHDGATTVGTATLNASGAAAVSNLTLSGGGHSLTAVYLGDAGFEGSTSDAVSHAVQSTTDVILTSPAATTYGEPVQASVTVAAHAGGVPTATGGVSIAVTTTGHQFSLGGGPLTGGAFTGPSVTNLAAGSYQVQASYGGDDYHAAATSSLQALTVSAAATTTALAGPASGTTVAGQPAPFTATVSSAYAIPSGTVDFDVDNSPTDVTVPVAADGTATFAPTGLGTGAHSITATYAPADGNFVTSTSTSLAHAVTQALTTTALSVPATSVAGESVSLAATVAPVAPAVAAPTGTVLFFETGSPTPLGSAYLVGGVATFTTSTLSVGAKQLTAQFAGSTDYLASTSTSHSHTVNKAGGVVALSSSQSNPLFGQGVDLTAVVTVAAPGSGVPTGAVVFKDGATVLGTVALSSGSATLTAVQLPAGDHTLTAVYGGDGRTTNATGGTVVSVAKTAPGTAITGVSPTPSRFGSPVTMTASVISPTGSSPTGMVEFLFGGNGNVVGQAPVVNGVATFTTSDLSVVRTIVSAHYLGDDNHLASYSTNDPLHTVLPAIYTVAVTAEQTPTQYGEKIRAFADVPAIGGRIPSGLVRFTILSTGTTVVTNFDGNGHAVADFDGVVAPGNPIISVSVDADFWFEASLDNWYTQEVDPGDATLSFVSDPASPTAGALSALKAQVEPAAAHGIGWVTFKENGVTLGAGAVDSTGLASAAVTFPTAGTHHVTAVYDGNFREFNVATTSMDVVVKGRSTGINFPGGSATYGDLASVGGVFFSLDRDTRLPTGTITVRSGATVLGSTAVDPSDDVGYTVDQFAIPVGRGFEPGSYPLTITYSGDTVYSPVTVDAALTIRKRPVTAVFEGLVFPGTVRAGDPVLLSGHIVVPFGLPAPATGTLSLGGGPGLACTVTLNDGATGGSCMARYDVAGTWASWATYSGDSRYEDVRSPQVDILVERNVTAFDVTAPFVVAENQAWTNSLAVPVVWALRSRGSATPNGNVEIWTNEGQQSCPRAISGTCDVHFANATADAWIEARFPGDSALLPTTERIAGKVTACYTVGLFGADRILTAPNCGTKFLAGTALDLQAAVPAGHTLVGWNEGPSSPTLRQTPIFVDKDLFLEPRFAPICFTVSALMIPRDLPRLAPTPAPNCDDAQTPEFGTLDLDAIHAAEVQAGAMRYRTGTKIVLPPTPMRLNALPAGMSATIAWSGDGVGTDGSLVVNGDKSVTGRLAVPCRTLVADGSPGAKVVISSTALDISKSPLLTANGNGGGRCSTPDGRGGLIPGTSVTVTMTPETGTWFDHWGPVESAASHRSPTTVSASDRPATAASTGTTTFVMPDADSAISGFAAGVTCFELKVNIADAVTADRLAAGATPASFTGTAPNCPTWWLDAHSIPRTGPRWYLSGTTIDVTASNDTRRGYVDEFALPKQIFFRGWSGGITSSTPAARVTVNGTVEATATWYIAAQCSAIVVKTNPASGGEALVSDLGDACPPRLSSFANVPPTPQAKLGSSVSLAARPNGSLQTIWQVEGDRLSNVEACTARENLIADKYAAGAASGKTAAEVDRILMEQGYLPGLVLARIQDEAAWRFQRGYTQAGIIGDLKTLGLLDANGVPVPDRLRDNPCNAVRRNTVLPAGQRVITLPADGDLVATAWFCQAVVPSVVIVGLDGQRHSATGDELDMFGPVFKSSDAASNCPAEGWFLPGTTAVLGTNGAGVPGYVIDGWSLDGVAAPAGPLSVPISAEGVAKRVQLTVKVVCYKLKVSSEFGSTAFPGPNCPGAAATDNLYALNTPVSVSAGEKSGYVWLGWHETGATFNPTLVKMDKDVTLTGNFRSQTVGEAIQESVIDPAIDAMGIAAKKVVGGLAYTIKGFADLLLDDGIFKSLSAIGTGLAAGFHYIGVQGAVLDGIVLGLQAPGNAFDGAMAGFDCVEEWAWGRSVPTLDDAKTLAKAAVTGPAVTEIRGVKVDDVVTAAQDLARRAAAGDPDALATLAVGPMGGGAAAMATALAIDIRDHPDVWIARAADAKDYALDFLATNFGAPFTWESSATEAWTTGGDQFLACMAQNGKDMASQ